MSLIDDAFEAFGGADALSVEQGESVSLLPFGVKADFIPMTGVLVNRDSLTGTNELPGDGRILERADERSERRSMTIDIPARYKVPEIVDRPNSSKFPHMIQTQGDGVLTIKKLMSRDASFDTYLVAVNDIAAMRMPGRTG
jgi:hypothetical protein